MIEQAKELIRQSFSGDEAEWYTDERVDRALNLCATHGILLVEDGFCLAYFRYYPQDKDAVIAMDFDELEQLDLATGPLLHVVLLIAPVNGGRLFRTLVKGLNVWGVTAHRWNKRKKAPRFASRRNVGFVEVRHGPVYRRQQAKAEEQNKPTV